MGIGALDLSYGNRESLRGNIPTFGAGTRKMGLSDIAVMVVRGWRHEGIVFCTAQLRLVVGRTRMTAKVKVSGSRKAAV